MKRTLTIVAIAAALLASSAARAQETKTKPAGVIVGRSGYANLGVGGGYMVNPEMGLGLVSLDYFITDEIAVGPYIHFGGGADNSFWGVSGQVKYCPELTVNKNVRPYLTAGIGFTDLDFKRHDGRFTTFLFPVGGGIEFGLSDIMSVEAGALYEITEDTFSGITVGLRVLL